MSLLQICLAVVGVLGNGPALPTDEDPESIKRGREAVRSVASPLSGSIAAWENLWRAWGLDEKPDDYADELFARYGLHPSDDPASEFPLGLTSVAVPFRPQLGHNCLMCHATRIAGRTIIGAGNASIDLQTLTEDLQNLDPLSPKISFRIGNERGTIEAGAGTAFLFQYRDSELNMRLPQKMQLNDHLRHDIPAWWHRKRKKTIFHTGSTDTRSVRANLTFLLAPIFSAQAIKDQQDAFRDIRNYLMTLEAPDYPFEVDAKLAAAGRPIFEKNCSECHGTYGPDGEYPNRIVPLEEIGTDPAMVEAYTTNPNDNEYYAASWIYREEGPNGEPYHGLNLDGYQAPPLDGVWATAPYFHNASVPTIEHVLNSKSRPAVFTRSYGTEEADYDKHRVGWKTQPVDPDSVATTKGAARRRVYDTREHGCRNTGHTFGDHLSPEERRQVIEYLKTL